MRPEYIRVRARSANEGSGTAGWSLAFPGPACFPMDEEGMNGVSWHLRLCAVLRKTADYRRAAEPRSDTTEDQRVAGRRASVTAASSRAARSVNVGVGPFQRS